MVLSFFSLGPSPLHSGLSPLVAHSSLPPHPTLLSVIVSSAVDSLLYSLIFFSLCELVLPTFDRFQSDFSPNQADFKNKIKILHRALQLMDTTYTLHREKLSKSPGIGNLFLSFVAAKTSIEVAIGISWATQPQILKLPLVLVRFCLNLLQVEIYGVVKRERIFYKTIPRALGCLAVLEVQIGSKLV
ncbi:hypothetical protein Syun_006834 [Stephania yunnanensis]|uniref:Uncharacterized protein n=1 Tax=Stephania yunnanensis TaxID=152371 RepID=A0AAP0PY11_9MAGN